MFFLVEFFGKRKEMKIKFFIIPISFCFCMGLEAMVKKSAFSLEQQTKAPLISLLDEAIYLHEMFYSGNEDQINLRASKMIQKINNIRRQSIASLPHHQRNYMERLLQDLSSQVESLKVSEPEDRVNNIHAINRQLTYMAKVYGVKKYNVFYCPTDRKVWMQGSDKNKPLHLNKKVCGTSVNKRKW